MKEVGPSVGHGRWWSELDSPAKLQLERSGTGRTSHDFLKIYYVFIYFISSRAKFWDETKLGPPLTVSGALGR